MQANKRVYPNEKKPAKWISYLLLFLSAVIILSGIVSPARDETQIEVIASPTPYPLEEAFDETPSTKSLVLPERNWYALQLGAYENPSSADEQAQIYQKRGAAGYLWEDGRIRVLAAVYSSKEDADAVRQQLAQRYEIDSFLYTISMPELELRLRGMAGQLELLEAAFLHADDAVSMLLSLSLSLDRQEISTAEAVSSLKERSQQLQMVTLRLHQRFSEPKNPTVSGLIGFFEDFDQFASTLDAASSASKLAQQLKYQTLQSLRLLYQLRNAM